MALLTLYAECVRGRQTNAIRNLPIPAQDPRTDSVYRQHYIAYQVSMTGSIVPMLTVLRQSKKYAGRNCQALRTQHDRCTERPGTHAGAGKTRHDRQVHP